MMLKRHDKQMEDFQVCSSVCAVIFPSLKVNTNICSLNIFFFQVASCTLDASTKIYSFRVDAIHSDVVQMATTMGRADTNRKKKSNDDDGAGPDDAWDMDNGDDGPQESQVLKKLKKKSRKVKLFVF